VRTRRGERRRGAGRPLRPRSRRPPRLPRTGQRRPAAGGRRLATTGERGRPSRKAAGSARSPLVRRTDRKRERSRPRVTCDISGPGRPGSRVTDYRLGAAALTLLPFRGASAASRPSPSPPPAPSSPDGGRPCVRRPARPPAAPPRPTGGASPAAGAVRRPPHPRREAGCPCARQSGPRLGRPRLAPAHRDPVVRAGMVSPPTPPLFFSYKFTHARVRDPPTWLPSRGNIMAIRHRNQARTYARRRGMI
jgi:hypothetical protein